jgi:hypothetical protein
VCVEAWEEPEARLVHRRVLTFREVGSGDWRRSSEQHSQHAFDRDEVLADLDAAGFDARPLRAYGADYRFRRGHAGFAAVRRP